MMESATGYVEVGEERVGVSLGIHRAPPSEDNTWAGHEDYPFTPFLPWYVRLNEVGRGSLSCRTRLPRLPTHSLGLALLSRSHLPHDLHFRILRACGIPKEMKTMRYSGHPLPSATLIPIPFLLTLTLSLSLSLSIVMRFSHTSGKSQASVNA